MRREQGLFLKGDVSEEKLSISILSHRAIINLWSLRWGGGSLGKGHRVPRLGKKATSWIPASLEEGSEPSKYSLFLTDSFTITFDFVVSFSPAAPQTTLGAQCRPAPG